MKLDKDFEAFMDAAYTPTPARDSEQWLDLRDAFYAGVICGVNATGADVRQAIEVHRQRAMERARQHDQGSI